MTVATTASRRPQSHLEDDRIRRTREVPYLRLVVSPDETILDPAHPIHPSIDHANQQRSHPVRRHPVRLTRRGRTVLWLILLGLAITAIALLAPPINADTPSGPPRTVTVHSGDTMWSIAENNLPALAPGVAVERIRVLNHLADDQIFAGEQLLIPPS
jgi:LysM repeat protein